MSNNNFLFPSPQPVQWRYAIQGNGRSLATFLGDAQVDGDLNVSGSINIEGGPYTILATDGTATLNAGAQISAYLAVTGNNGGVAVTSLGVSALTAKYQRLRFATGGFTLTHSATLVCEANGNASLPVIAGMEIDIAWNILQGWTITGIVSWGTYSSFKQYDAADNITPRLAFGADRLTTYPGWMIGGPTRGGAQGRFLALYDVGDTSDLACSSVDGTPAAPTEWIGFIPHTTWYDWSPQIAQTRTIGPSAGAPNNATYIGRHSQYYSGQCETPADGSLGGWTGIGVTVLGDTVPWLRMWASGNSGAAGSGNGGVVFPGRSNVPGQEARVSDGGALIAAPYTYTNFAQIYSAGFVNPQNIFAQANAHYIASDQGVAFAAIALRDSDAYTYGIDITRHHGSDTTLFFPVVAGARIANAVGIDSAANLVPWVDNTGQLGTNAKRFAEANVFTVTLGNADTTLSRAGAGLLGIEADIAMMRANAESVSGAKTFATSALRVVDANFVATSDATDCRWQFDAGDYLEFNRSNNRWRRVIGGATVEELTANLDSHTNAHLALSATAIPAGGTAGAGYRFSSTANFGLFFGSGAPTLAAAKGSAYLRSDGSGVADRMYINTDGGTTWTSVATAA